VNCIREGIIPFRYFERSSHKVHAANGNLLRVSHKIPEVHVCISGVCLKTSFLLIKNLNQGVILGTLFLSLIRPFLVTEQNIQFSIKGKQVELKFISQPEETLLNHLKEQIHHKEQLINRLPSKSRK
jgi:hypothetical protein